MAVSARHLLLCAAALVAAAPVLAQQPPAAATAPAAAPVDPAVAAAQKAYDAQSEAERKAIQDDLVWSGDYLGITQGVFGKRTFDAIAAFQKRNKAQGDGILKPDQRKALEVSARQAREAVKFALVQDPRTGVKIGVPASLAVKRDDKADTGTRWFNDQNSFSVRTAVAQGGAAELPQAFERVVNQGTPGRKVTYKLLRPDFFVVAGDISKWKFYTRYAAGPQGLRGYTVVYEAARAKEFERIMIAIANTFEPFPAAQASAAAAPAAAPPQPVQPAALAPPPPPAERRGNALVLADGRSVAPAALVASCKSVTVQGQRAEVSFSDPAAGLALLSSNVKRQTQVALRSGAVEPGESLVFTGFTADPAARGISIVSGEGGHGGAIVAALQPGAGGGAVFDRSGRLAGIAAVEPSGRVRVAGIAPAARHALIGAEALKGFAAARGLDLGAGLQPPARELSAGEIAHSARGASVQVVCGL